LRHTSVGIENTHGSLTQPALQCGDPKLQKTRPSFVCSAVRWKRLLASAQKGWLEEGYETIQHSTDRVKVAAVQTPSNSGQVC
jgi:hypothetical protein